MSITIPDGGVRGGAVDLRPLAESDAPAFLMALEDPAVSDGAYHGRLDGGEDVVREYLARNAERMAAGEAVLLGVWEAEAQRLSGSTMVFRVDRDERVAELGFWIAPWARGRGLATKALRLTVGLAIDHLGVERLTGLTGVDNAGAQRAMEAAGLRREGVLRGLERTPTGRLDQVSFAVLASDRP
ncbi:MAG TPA: GNAT family N-acetyltransferase [Thermoleophilaceae bacterium]|nr:GNAT family N-acetyltransferase [Thermoleophilaceae bacterium]